MKKVLSYNKKAISPLIATVLLIGFAISLAVIVIFWGRGLITGILEKEAPFSQGKLECETNTAIDIGDVACYEPENFLIKVEVKNEKNTNIQKFRANIYGGQDSSFSTVSASSIDSFGKRILNFKYGSTIIEPVERIEILPIILYENVEVTCASKKLDVVLIQCK